jgi:hypothetical protein
MDLVIAGLPAVADSFIDAQEGECGKGGVVDVLVIVTACVCKTGY